MPFLPEAPMDRFRVIFGAVIVVAWIGSIIASALVDGFEMPETIHPLMMVIAGALFGPKILGKNGNGKPPAEPKA